MNVTLARHYGMCFGVRDALRAVHAAAQESPEPVTVLGELVHNRTVRDHLGALGVREAKLEDLKSSTTTGVVITAHGASDERRIAWADAGHTVTDTTCPLVRKAHAALAGLVAEGFFPVVFGKADHVEVRGLAGDFPDTVVVTGPDDFHLIPDGVDRIGMVSQTTQPIHVVQECVALLGEARPEAEVRFVDTVCQPTKDRQRALADLCAENELVVVVGGSNSNNTRQLAQTVETLGARSLHVETCDDLDPAFFKGVEHVGVTAGTSTLDETVQAVVARIRKIAAERKTSGAVRRLIGDLAGKGGTA